ncbi:MAG TPA: NAD(P)-dependent oxidoreductase [Candidatus Latescibacteria bacterium]|nr:NAD(P)-dependent oxidoreductase [Candidatus Latescibacterota bacterium]
MATDRKPPGTDDELIECMTTPSAAVCEAVAQYEGDVIILGVGGKMGPTLAELLLRAGGGDGGRRVIGVARFSDPRGRDHLEEIGVTTIQADLLEDQALRDLPDAPHVFLLAGFKFGATGNPSMTWAMNSLLPARAVERYREAQISYVSSGNVYAYTAVAGGGAGESDVTEPVGEYAQSRLGGERLAEFAARSTGARLCTLRLFYATELRYGIIHDIAWRVWTGEPIDVSMGHVNQIWQGDANAYLARSFPLCTNPPTTLNMTGERVLSVRATAVRLGAAMGREPVFVGVEAETALLGDTSALVDELGPPETSIDDVIDWMAHWVQAGGTSYGKPTKYESRTGDF